MNEIFDIAWSSRAGKDLQKIKTYYEDNASEEVSKKILRAIVSVVQPTAQYPEKFPPDLLLKKYGNFRFIKKWNFRVIYEFTGHQIIVHRIVHAKQNMKSVLRYVR